MFTAQRNLMKNLYFVLLFLTSFTFAQCPTPPGNQTTYGTNSWIGYVYNPVNSSNPPTNCFQTTYRGYITQPETFNQDLGYNSISGSNLCNIYIDQFAIRYKMVKNLAPGYYTFTVGGDDGYRLSIDGGNTYLINEFYDQEYSVTTSTSIYLSGTTYFVLDYYDKMGLSRISFNYTACTSFSSAPTAISGPDALCNVSGGTTLTASGGTSGIYASYEWGTGSTVGSNIISGQTNASIYVNPSATTTYWVRRKDGSPCNLTTAGVTKTITVSTQSTQPTSITGNANICQGDSTTLTALGGTHGTDAEYQWGTGYSAGTNIIPGATGSSITVFPSSQTGYWVRRVDPAPCNTNTGHTTFTVAVTTRSSAPTFVTGNSFICNNNTGTTLTANGGTSGNNSSYQWGTGSTVGNNIITGETSASIYVSPTATTTYWVRRLDAGSCNLPSAGITHSVLVSQPSTAPTSISGTTSICSGSNTTLTANGGMTGTNGAFQWGTGWTVGSNIIPGATTNKITVNPTTTTIYWVRRVDPSPCNNNTAAASTTVTVTTRSTAPTSITGNLSICSGSSTTLTATGATLQTGATYQWGTGATVGSGVITGQTSASITVSPTSSTTYWVRVKDNNSPCNAYTNSRSVNVTVYAPTVAGTLSTSNATICKNTQPNTITLTGNTGSVLKWQYASNNAFTVGVMDIANTATTLTGAQMGTLSATRYYRAVVKNGACLVENTTPIQITVPAAVTYNGSSWSATPSSTTPVVINGNLVLNSSLNVCSCQITNSATVRVTTGNSLVVQNDLSIAPTAMLIFEDTASLVQISDSATNTGTIVYKRKSTPLKQYDYTYWATPVANQALSVLGSPSLFYAFSPTLNNWSYQAATTTMQKANGYISRAPNNLDFSTPKTIEVTFNGTPNNGIISAPIVKDNGTFNLIGNPYPSAIDIDAFLLDPANTGIVNGTVYLWTHNSAISSNIPGNDIYNYTRDDYAKYNITGGVKTASSAISGGAQPTGKIAAGQGFFIEANSSLANGSYQATFKNSMRISGQNNQFFKINANNNGTNEPIAGTIQKNRIWLNITNPQGAYDEMLVGYITGATNEFDTLYDGKVFPAGNVVSIYSTLASDKYAIQGRALPFANTDIVPFGYTCSIAGNFTISLEKFDGLFNQQDVYLLDKTTNQFYNLKESGFTFASEIGTFNDRFEIHYTAQSLGTNDLNESNAISIIKTGKHITVESTQMSIDSIQIFDLIGKQLYSKKQINQTIFNTSELTLSTQVLIVKVTLENGTIVTKKLLMN